MANRKRNILNELIELAQEILRRLDEALQPPREPEPARVPIPVRNDPQLPNSYEDSY